MKLKQLLPKNLLIERYITLLSPTDRTKYIDIVWELMEKAYAKLGGFKSADDKQDLIDKTSIWKLVRKNGKIVAVTVYKDKYGRKCIASGTDGTPEGKAALLQMWLEDTKQNRAWGEFSGPSEHIKLKQGMKPIPNKYAADILQKPIISLNPDGYHYTRMIGGEPHEKLLAGNVEGFNFG